MHKSYKQNEKQMVRLRKIFVTYKTNGQCLQYVRHHCKSQRKITWIEARGKGYTEAIHSEETKMLSTYENTFNLLVIKNEYLNVISED